MKELPQIIFGVLGLVVFLSLPIAFTVAWTVEPWWRRVKREAHPSDQREVTVKFGPVSVTDKPATASSDNPKGT